MRLVRTVALRLSLAITRKSPMTHIHTIPESDATGKLRDWSRISKV